LSQGEKKKTAKTRMENEEWRTKRNMTVPQNDLTHPPPVVRNISPCTLWIGSKKFTPAAPVCEPTRTIHRSTQPTDAVANTSHPTDGAFTTSRIHFWRRKKNKWSHFSNPL
jgi:hypothetical protein